MYSTVQCTSNLHSNVSRSTRINSSSVHTYIFVCFIRNSLRVILQGFVDPIMQHGVRSGSISNAIQFNSVYSTVQCTSNLHSNVSRSTRINSSSVHTYIFVCFIRNSLRVILQGFVDPIMQHGVRIEAVFASLQ